MVGMAGQRGGQDKRGALLLTLKDMLTHHEKGSAGEHNHPETRKLTLYLFDEHLQTL